MNSGKGERRAEDAVRIERIRVIDSHTGGEPTRVVIEGGPDLGHGSMADRRTLFAQKADDFRSTVVNEPRGSDVIVGALLCEPLDPECVAGVLFFNNVGPLWMCGHGTIGVGVTLGHLGRITRGTYQLETAVGRVKFEYDGANRVTLENVPSYRLAKDVTVDVAQVGTIVGDIAWGGNWFFLVDAAQFSRDDGPFDVNAVERLTDIAWRIRQSLEQQGITGANGALIDHIELFGPPADANNDCRNFVLCPGRAYDRSPCGTGTSAKMACLYADGHLKPGEIWRQESILGSLFEGSIRLDGEKIIPRISGTAYITAETTLILENADPFRTGIRR